MDKLTIEHVAPYLPYELNAMKYDSYGNSSEVTLDIWCLNKYPLEYNDIKPILRPLSDLTKMFNGDSCFISYMWYGIISTDSDCFDKDDFFEKCELGMVNHLPYMVIPFLLEHHFDVFGLIDKGLAIDINTLKGGSK